MSYSGSSINDNIEMYQEFDPLLKMGRIPYVLNIRNISTSEHAHEHQGSLY